jgi:leader peptidase (prepilin peptidase) / N-methyltransferase
LATAFFLFGIALGSFLNVCIYRLPRGLSVVRPRSACPQCGTAIAAYDNIPLLSWLLLRGRCRSCRAPISPRYFAVELLTGAMFVICFLTFGPTLAAAKYCVLSFLLIGLVFTDATTQLLPDALTLPGLALGLLFSFFVPVWTLIGRLFPYIELPVSSDYGWRIISFGDALLGAAVGASFIYGVGAIYQRARGVEAMGFGDVKLMAMIGACVGIRLTVFTIFAASLTGSLYGLSTIFIVWLKRTRRRVTRFHEPARAARRRAWQSANAIYRRFPIPFGVFLGAMALLAVFFGDRLMDWYWGRYL